MDKDENAIMISKGATYDGDETFYVSGYNPPDMEDGESDKTNGKDFETKEEAITYAKELAQKLKGGEAKEEPLLFKTLNNVATYFFVHSYCITVRHTRNITTN